MFQNQGDAAFRERLSAAFNSINKMLIDIPNYILSLSSRMKHCVSLSGRYQRREHDQLISGVNFQDQSVNHRRPHLSDERTPELWVCTHFHAQI